MIRNPVRPLVNGLLDLIFPHICLLCRSPLDPSEPGAQLCPVCLSLIHYNRPVFCRRCSRPISSKTHPFCRHCARSTLFFDRSWSAAIYDDTLRHLLHLFKYGQQTGLRTHFADCITAFVREYHIPVYECDIIIPVPLHRTRLRERGFNQSALIARILSQRFQIPCHESLLTRIRHTVNQARLNSKQRWTNVCGTFKINHSDMINNTNILVIDDLMTTGATLSETARALKASGAKKVYGLTAAIALLHR